MGIPVGISACVMGQKVRFDGGHKQNKFAVEELSKYFKFEPVCPEVGAGMTVPRPTIRLLAKDEDDIRLVATKDISEDFTDKMTNFIDKRLPSLNALCGFIVCAKSPTCGMERVKLYIENGNTLPGGTTGLFTKRLMQDMPWLPVEEDGRLQDPVLRENFVARVYALHDLYECVKDGITRAAIVNYHSRYKLTLMAHNNVAYKELGQLVASIADWDSIDEFFIEYRQKMMDALTHRASRKNNTNVLMHLQGYFKRSLTKKQKAELNAVIFSYSDGLTPLIAPLTLINHYLSEHPDGYLETQFYLNPHPADLRLRYAL
ncbi:hypothetical protein BCU68_02915 [Vibrio sp. 10N.286.49.B3]|uniref:YbgA family protein n=1 Tax=Vibrio sp. 10N.286.49.B3 TaxID=1880855 RepID=UPI000C86423B|nr:DUF523 and DUF1722 domain-containing protein [Vibrio sp. 10N.286.49.B3]PMH44470.1 hypothetical protein BCU68_02915 [Vibrio sp. 10N.286.49.B3]